jgi:hypothetical protein
MKKADNFDASKWLVENKITTQSRLNEDELNQNELKQDILDFWGTLQDDAAQSGGEYKASWDTNFFLDVYEKYKGKETEVRKAVNQMKQQGELSLYKKREKGNLGTGSVLDFVKQNFDSIMDKASKATEYKSDQERRKERFEEVKDNPDELIEGNEDLVQMYVMLPEYVRRKPANYDYRAGYSNVPTGKEVKKPFFQMAFDKNKITRSRSSAKKIIVNGVELYISHLL